LEWENANAAVIELNDPSTLNAMTQGLLKKLAARLSFAFAARSVRTLVLQGAGPHFCTGGRYDK
jgi:enoyl-CoA hydratase/carnithine racemase